MPICTAPLPQTAPTLVPDGAGGAIIVWQDGRNPLDTLGSDVYAQRVTSDGTIAPGWQPNGVPVCNALGDESVLDIIPDGAGGAIVVWQDYRQGSNTVYDIYAQRITPSGTAAPGWPVNGLPVCTAIHDQRFPHLCTDGAGGAIITWEDPRNSPEGYPISQVYAQRVTANGTIAPGWPVDGILVCSAPPGQYAPRIAEDGSGGAFITYDSRGQLFAQRITASGTIASGWDGGGNIVCSLPQSRPDPSVISDGAGGAFISWQDWRKRTDYDIYMERITGAGTISTGWPSNGLAVCTAPGDQGGFGLFYDNHGPSITSDGAGGAIVAWEDLRNGLDSDIYAQRVLADGTTAGGWIADGVPVSRAKNWQDLPEVVGDGAGGALLAWRDARSDTGYRQDPRGPNVDADIYTQHLGSDGSPAGGWFADGNPICTAPNYQFTPTIASDGSGEAIITWTDFRSDTGNYQNGDIYAQRIMQDMPTATLISVVGAEARDGTISLTWSYTAGHALVARVFRSSGGGMWQPIGQAIPRAPNRLTYADRNVVPGSRYGYRLAIQEGGIQGYFGEVWAEVPKTLSFGLEVAQPNPSSGNLTVSVTLPISAAARLELHDIAGRRVLVRDIGGLGVGRHVLVLGEARGLQSGLYVVRLAQGGHMASTRAIIIR